MRNNSRVIPVLLLKGHGLVKTVRFKNPVYIGDPINAVKIFNEKEVDELVLLDIWATHEKKTPNFVLIEQIASEAFMPIGYGGGIRSLDDIERLFKIGIEKIIINTVAYDNPYLIQEAVKTYGNQSIVISVDVRKNWRGKYVAYSNAGKKKENIDLLQFLKKAEELGAGEVLINAIDNDGLMTGYDISLIKYVSAALSVPLIACGGAGGINDIKDVLNAGGASAAAAGSLFVFQGPHKAVLISYINKEVL